MKKCLAVLLALALLAGCSVVRAANGSHEPNLSRIHVGALRGEIETELGAPLEELKDEQGRPMAIYAYVMGDEPSGGRAIAHGLADVASLGLWEIIGSNIEKEGEARRVVITYGPDERVVNIKASK